VAKYNRFDTKNKKKYRDKYRSETKNLKKPERLLNKKQKNVYSYLDAIKEE